MVFSNPGYTQHDYHQHCKRLVFKILTPTENTSSAINNFSLFFACLVSTLPRNSNMLLPEVITLGVNRPAVFVNTDGDYGCYSECFCHQVG